MFDVILINYNCMHQVKNLTRQLILNPLVARIVIINNSKLDHADWETFEISPKILCVSALRNTGYAGGNQLGFDILQGLNTGNHLCVLNADVEFPSDILDIGMALLSKDINIGQISFRTEDGKGNFSYDALKLRGLIHEKPQEHKRNVEPSDYAAGSFFLLRNDARVDVGCLFFEPFFLYWEEVDLSLRLRNAGWKIVCCTERTVIRNANTVQAEIRSIYYIVRNAFLFASRNRVNQMRWMQFFFRYFLASTRLALCAQSASPLFNFFSGLFDGIRGKYGER